ncbi:hypothetical protein BSZ37_20375 [Rubrivirga marina]|uniref:PIN domain-containing protein n=1 Tax=Rubrivirga marina TaxID=1196024 RepID=A0A271ITU8_9BACT|nr:hypothetical protein BSZ37_20375 [Rubrivirga marina]
MQRGDDGHTNVRAWLDSVDDCEVRLSVMTIREVSRGIERLAKTKPDKAAEIRERFDELMATYASRVVEIGVEAAEEWGRLEGEKAKHRDDLAFVATARVREMVLVTRNVKDVRGRGVRVLNPFTKPWRVVDV